MVFGIWLPVWSFGGRVVVARWSEVGASTRAEEGVCEGVSYGNDNGFCFTSTVGFSSTESFGCSEE